MPAAIKRIVAGGLTYEMKQPFPGVEQDSIPDNEKLRVAWIGFFASEEELKTDGEGDDETDVGSETSPAYYEVWAAPDRVIELINADLKGELEGKEAEMQYLASLGEITRRIIDARNVSLMDEEWDVLSAYKEMRQRIYDWNVAAMAEIKQMQEEHEAGQKAAAEKQNGQPQAASA